MYSFLAIMWNQKKKILTYSLIHWYKKLHHHLIHSRGRVCLNYYFVISWLVNIGVMKFFYIGWLMCIYLQKHLLWFLQLSNLFCPIANLLSVIGMYIFLIFWVFVILPFPCCLLNLKEENNWRIFVSGEAPTGAVFRVLSELWKLWKVIISSSPSTKWGN